MTTTPQVPWSLSDARTVFFTTAGGLGGLVLAWWGSSGTGKLERQIAWMSLGVVAVVIIGVGNFLWLLAGRRSVGVRRRAVLDSLDGSLPIAPDAGFLSGELVTIEGSTRYHLGSCQLVHDKATTPVPAIASDGLVPCEMCCP